MEREHVLAERKNNASLPFPNSSTLPPLHPSFPYLELLSEKLVLRLLVLVLSGCIFCCMLMLSNRSLRGLCRLL